MKNKFFENKYLLCGLILIGLLLMAALFAPLICHYAPDNINPEKLLTPPDTIHFFGTDQLGRDLFARIIYGSRISLTVGITVVCISTIIGTSLGAIAGYRAGMIDYFIMRFTDCMLCFPVFFLILTVIALLEPSVFNIILILGLTSWMSQARLIRAEILSLKSREFVLAAKAYGASDYLIIKRHLIPVFLAIVSSNRRVNSL
ncbi:MAG: ABC transporter permease [Candidatus Omnitrophota bacterium]